MDHTDHECNSLRFEIQIKGWFHEVQKKKEKPLNINDITIIDDGKLKKPSLRRRWVMRWSGLTLGYTVS